MISPPGTELVSESEETNYNTESYTDDEESHNIVPRGDDSGSSITHTETDSDDQIDDDDDDDDNDDQTEGSVTPTTRSRRSTVSEVSTNESEIDTGASTARLQSGQTTAYTRKPGSGNGNSLK